MDISNFSCPLVSDSFENIIINDLCYEQVHHTFHKNIEQHEKYEQHEQQVLL